jgi:RNA polymerase sigma-70 factor (ECF subfamily)
VLSSPHSSISTRSSTHDLARRFAAGDPEVLDPIQQRYGPGMLAAARDRLGGDRVLAEEAVQVALLKAWRAAPSFDASRDLGPWLYAITRRCAIDIRRHEFRHRTESIERVSRLPGDGDADGFETAWETNVVREAVAALPAAERTVMRLTYYDALTHQEIAQHLAIPIGTVKSRTARAHARLRATVKPRVALAS